MNNLPVVCVTIPTYNCADELDATVQSVLAQEYDRDKIILLFADFGSDDGTQEKILGYRSEWTGMFSFANKRTGRTMTADAFSMWKYQNIPGCPFLLRPGDTLYPHCFKTFATWQNRAERQKYQISFLLSETDIIGNDGKVCAQIPLFTKPCLLRAYSEDSYEYVKKGYRHAVLPFGHNYSDNRDKSATLGNLDIWWNRFAQAGFSSNVLYINEPLGCLKIKDPDDELDDILFAFEQALTIFRMSSELPDFYVVNERFELSHRSMLSKYALWRTFLLHKRGLHKEAEDCLLLARIINPELESEECWRHAERFVLHSEADAEKWLGEYFSHEEPPDNPKWPMGIMLTCLWQRLRQKLSREKTSRFYR